MVKKRVLFMLVLLAVLVIAAFAISRLVSPREEKEEQSYKGARLVLRIDEEEQCRMRGIRI